MSPADDDRTPADGLENETLLALLSQLDLEEKVLILTGRDFWSTWPIEKIGLRSMVVSDGPSGVRGEVWDERSPSINLPSATALSSSWDPTTAYTYGTVSANEARRKGVDVVLGPTINLHRSPLGGRHFEAFSEDPMLTAELAAAYVRGAQDSGVGATPKHYIANDFETERFDADVIVDDRSLRELYLLAFEKSIVEARAWAVMSSYNSINGATATENHLLETPLNDEWGFDGVVVSDWTAVRSLHSAEFSQDLVMPGPKGPWGDALVEAVRNGEIDEAMVDRKVLRLLLLAARVGALADFDPPKAPHAVDGNAFSLDAEIDGTVLVRNEGALPIAPGSVSSIAVIGHNAVHARTQGGGSATVIPETVISPLDGIRAAFADADITYSRGAIVQEGVSDFDPSSMTNPVTGGPGAHIRMLDGDGNELFAEDRFAGSLVYFGGDAPIAQTKRFEFSTQWTPNETGRVRIGCASVGTARIFINDELIDEQKAFPVGNDLGAAFLAPPSMTVEVDAVAGVPIDFRLEHLPLEEGALAGAMSITFGIEPPAVDPQDLIAEAAAAAAAAEVAIVVVGTNSRVESEGYDRTNLDLPGRQDELVRAVTAANPRTIVIVNSGSPVVMPWRNDVAAVILSWFGGQQYGKALADVITGAAEPGGRLPTTWPATQADVPVLDVTPVDHLIRYDEGIHIGYRAWLKAQTDPAYPFGFGLGYTTWALGAAEVRNDGETITVAVPLTNSGDRAGKQVVQIYAARTDSAVDRPIRWLVGFAAVRAEAGAATTATIEVPRRAFAHWDGEWKFEAGRFELLVATSVTEVVETLSVDI